MKKRDDYSQYSKAMLGRIKTKSGIAFLIAMVLILVLIVRVIIINVADGEEYSRIVLNHQAYSSRTIASKRGSIVDRNGTVLAYSKKVYNLVLDPFVINSDEKKKDATVDAVSEYFGIDKNEIEDVLTNQKDSRYRKMKSELEEDFVNKFKAQMEENENIDGVWFEDDYKRVYPFGTLAADVIGFYNKNNGGELGLEKKYDSDLTGTDGLAYTYVDDSMERTEDLKSAVDGNNVVTTLDYGAQNIIDKYIANYNSSKPSANTGAILMDPNSGEVLAMSSYPFFDLNNPRDLTAVYTDEQIAAMSEEEKAENLAKLWRNYCVSDVYEPGSTFKSITVAGCLEEGVVKDGDQFYCGGSLSIGGYTINCWRHIYGGHGQLSLDKALGDSCNVAMMEIAANLGTDNMIKYQSLFGFGSKTGIDLPSEERGILQDAEKMSVTDLATNSFGQNFDVTMIQMAAAYCSLINGGTYYQPHIVKSIENEKGEKIKSVTPTSVRQTVTADTSNVIKRILKEAVEQYGVTYVKVDGYSIGGKTGTAQKLPRSEKKWLISVAAFAPAENPQYVLYVVIDEPQGTTGTSGSGMDVQELTHDVLAELLPYLGVPKDTTATTENGNSESGSEGEGGIEVPEGTTLESTSSSDE